MIIRTWCQRIGFLGSGPEADVLKQVFRDDR